MSLHITTRDDLSLLDLCRLHEQGKHILKTPHVGNFYPNNLVMAMLGIPILCVDRTIGNMDRNFHPHRVVYDKKALTIAQGHKLTTHTEVTKEHPQFSKYFPLGGNVADGHMRALRDAFPGAPIETQTECLIKYGDRVITFLSTLTRFFPSEWKRFVHANGAVENRSMFERGWKNICTEGIHGVDLKNGAGWIIPNEWAILWDVVIAGMNGQTEAYELSGPDMVNYVGKLAGSLDRAYTVLRTELKAWNLPEQMTCCIVPVAGMRLAVAGEQQLALENLVDAYLELERKRKQWSASIQSCSNGDRFLAVGRVVEERSRLNERLCELVIALPDIFYRIEDASFLSQYDLLMGKRLYVHPWGLEAPVAKVDQMIQYLSRLKN